MAKDLIQGTVADSEQTISRAVEVPADVSSVYTLRDLQAQEFVTTPLDTPLFTMLMKKGAERAYTQYFEWVETSLSNTFSAGVYDGYDISGLDGSVQTPSAKGNYLMAYGAVARVGGMVNSFKQINGNAMLTELKNKYANLIRGIEYYLWNGDHTASADQTNGIVALITTAVANGAAALVETKFQTAIVQALDAGVIPDKAFTSFIIAQRITNFAKDRIRYLDVNNATGGVGFGSFFYTTPFGYTIEVVPVRTTFLPTGSIYVLDSTMIVLRYSGDDVLVSEQKPEAQDGQAVLLKSYFGLELKDAAKMRVVTGITEALV